MIEKELCGYTFRLVCKIVPEMNGCSPIEYMPQSQYNNVHNLPLNKYGKGPFCRFKISSKINQKGVYTVAVNGIVKYVGECENLSDRWNLGYGNISPRNCFVGGQSTNCRINNLILSMLKEGNSIDLFFYQTESMLEVENDLIRQLRPEWNVKINVQHGQKRIAALSGRNKYQPLTNYLLNSQEPVECLTYDQIEGILGFQLPHSASTFNAWWANSGHNHAKTWTSAGRAVASVNLGQSITFLRKSRSF
jgi:hypothetical protein